MAGSPSGASQCLHVGSFDVTPTAAGLSQLAGVLAGFGFFALIFILTSTATADDRPAGQRLAFAGYDEALLTLFCATFGLAITAVQFAILAGERTPGLYYGRASSEELMANISLSLSIFLLVAGMLRLVAPGFAETRRTVRLLAAVVGPPMTVFFVAETAREVAVETWAGESGVLILCGGNSFYSAVQLWARLVAPLLVFGIALSFWIVPKYLSAERKLTLERIAARGKTAIPLATLFAVVIAAAIGVSFEEFHPHSHIPQAGVWVALVATAALVLAQAFLLRFRPEEGRQHSHPGI